MSTPSRVTRSQSRQPERSAASRGSTPARTASTTGSAKKKTTSSRRQSTRDESPQPAVSKTPASTRKPVVAEFQFTDGGYIDEGLRSRATADSRQTRSSTQRNGDAAAAAVAAAAVPDAEPVVVARPPLIALLPHSLVYLALVSVAHFLVVYDFASAATQSALVKALTSCACVTGLPQLADYLAQADALDLAFYLVVPLYLVAGFLLRSGVALVVGPGGRSATFAANLARVLDTLVFIATVGVLDSFGVLCSYASINALFVLQFGAVLQDFLLNFTRFTGPRVLYALITIALTGYVGFLAYAIEKLDATTESATSAPALLVGVTYALVVVSASSGLAALSGFFSFVGCSFMSTVSTALQSVVNFGAVPILAVALYLRVPALFGEATAAGATLFETSAASAVLVTLVLLLVVDAYATDAKPKRA